MCFQVGKNLPKKADFAIFPPLQFERQVSGAEPLTRGWHIHPSSMPPLDAIFFSVPLFGLIFIFHFENLSKLFFFQMRM